MKFTATKDKKGEMVMDHNPVWAGDGYFCVTCMLRFVPQREPVVDAKNVNKVISELHKEIDQPKPSEEKGKLDCALSEFGECKYLHKIDTSPSKPDREYDEPTLEGLNGSITHLCERIEKLEDKPDRVKIKLIDVDSHNNPFTLEAEALNKLNELIKAHNLS